MSFYACAEVALPGILAEHMVVQRNLPVHIWGKAAPKEAVSVAFRGASQSTAADALGRWSVFLPPGEAGGPFDLTIKGANTIEFKDVLVGDVWIASGQSNMEFQLRQAADAANDIAAAKYPNIRFLKVARTVADYPLDNASVMRSWADINQETAPLASAVGYFFARNLHQKLNVPVGVIDSTWGGTPADAWTSLHAIGEDPALMPVFAEWARATDSYSTMQATYEMRLQDWTRTAEKAKAEGKPEPPKPPVPGTRPGGQFTPAGLYNAMIAPLTPFAIRGAIWYQGETNATPTRAPIYARLFQTMIRDWRRAWGQGDFPFLFVQLANFQANPSWPEVREAQRQTLSLANTGMAVTIDIGNPTNIHPTNKLDVGLRLALAARAIAYGEKVEYSGPAFRQVVTEGSSMRVWFDHGGNGLMSKGGTALKGFEIAGADRKYVAAEARFDGSSVVVSSASVAAPVYVRYGWADNPECNLFNVDGLPASPFRSAE